jgi:hypothetical protein
MNLPNESVSVDGLALSFIAIDRDNDACFRILWALQVHEASSSSVERLNCAR